jgi:23S rRNA (cytidine1920-2'-O)/16S rRNA (cytidine1409-2'-O)-methyltransferase
MSKQRIDEAMVKRGLISSRQKAQEQIKKGLVQINQKIILKPSTSVSEEDQVILLEKPRYVSRGGEKLEAALNYFQVDIKGKTYLDVGASTGGFTDCLLQHGAAHVVAIDVGHGQFSRILQQDKRVESLEGIHISHFQKPEWRGKFDGIVIDLSFISLLKVLPAVVDFAASHSTLLALIKPQFEVGKDLVKKGGIVKDSSARESSVQRIVEWFASKPNWKVTGTMASPILGGDGNQEYFLCSEKSAM